MLAGTNIWFSVQMDEKIKEVEAQEEHESDVLRLAEHLRHTSDDLTRFAREYIQTGDPSFLANFNHVLDIRAGRTPRPQGYDGIYWDFVVAGRMSGPDADSGRAALSLHEMAQALGISDEQYQLLLEAERRSDELAELEQLAFAAYQGNYEHPETGEQITGQPNPELARQLLYGNEYLHAKADIMEPLAEFNESVLYSSQSQLLVLEQDVARYVLWDFFSAMGLLGVILLTSLVLSNRVLDRVTKLAAAADAVDKGSLYSRSGVKGKDELGMLGQTFDHMVDQLSQSLNALSKEKKAVENQNLKLHEVNEIKNKFVGMAAHDLRNPLTSIRGFAEILLHKSSVPDEDKEFLKIIQMNSANMLQMVNELLDVSVMESGNIELNPMQFSFQKLLDDRITILDQVAKDKNTRLVTECGNEGMLIGDRDRLGQVIDNLITNAIKFSPATSTIRIALDAIEGRVRFSVTDEGPGLTDEDKKKMFGDFQRLSARPTGKESSTGLGLSIVKRIVDAHNGRIHVESEFGKGAAFIVELPVGNIASADSVADVSEPALAE